jgi:hypothetical protein
MEVRCLRQPAVEKPFLENLAALPLEINRQIWADYFRLCAEDHADKFADVHDEIFDYYIKVKIANKYVFRLCRAANYYSQIDIDDLWLHPYTYKYAIEAQVKRDCLRLLEKYWRRPVNQPTVRFGDVIVTFGETFMDAGKPLGDYLKTIPGPKDYTEDMNEYDRRSPGRIEWLDYEWPNAAEMTGVLTFSSNSGNSMPGRGVSGLGGFGAAGLDSGTNLGGEDENEDENEDDSLSWTAFMEEAAADVAAALADSAAIDAAAASVDSSTAGGSTGAT